MANSHANVSRRRALGSAIVLTAVLSTLLCPILPRAELHRGHVEDLQSGGGWDFSDSAFVPFWEGDVGYFVTLQEASPENEGDASNAFDFLMGRLLLITISSEDSVFNSVTEAPPDDYSYQTDYPAYWYGIYVVKTQEGHYAKFHLTQSGGWIDFDYVYQDDGTRILEPGVAAEETTWGRIKAIYD